MCRDRGAAFVWWRWALSGRRVRLRWAGSVSSGRCPGPGGRSPKNHAPALCDRWQGWRASGATCTEAPGALTTPPEEERPGRRWGGGEHEGGRGAARLRALLGSGARCTLAGAQRRAGSRAGHASARVPAAGSCSDFRRGRRRPGAAPGPRRAANMGNAGSMDSQQTDFRAHNVPLKLPMPEPGELEERFAIVLVSAGRWRGAGDSGPWGREAQLIPAASLSPCAWSESPAPRGRRPPSPYGLPSSLLSSPLQPPPRSALSGSWARAGCLAGPEPIVWRVRHLTARVPGRCGVGVKGRWRGSGRRGLRAAKAFCLKTNKSKNKTQNPRKLRGLADHPAGMHPRAGGVRGGRVASDRPLAAGRGLRRGELAGGGRCLAVGSVPEREGEENPWWCGSRSLREEGSGGSETQAREASFLRVPFGLKS